MNTGVARHLYGIDQSGNPVSVTLVPTVYHDGSTLIYIDSINPVIILIVPFQVFSQRLIFIVGNVFLDFDNDQSAHRHCAILAVFCCFFLRKALQTIALVGG